MVDPKASAVIDDDIADDFRLLGAEIDPEAVEDEDHILGIWRPNWLSFRGFLACQTQWRGSAGQTRMIWTGLDYAAVDAVLRRLKLPDAIFDDLQYMESKALEAFDEVPA